MDNSPESTKTPAQQAWHSLNTDEVLRLLETRKEGLGRQQAQERLARYGPNTLKRARRESPLRLLWRQISNPLIYILLASALLAFFMGKRTDGLVVLGVVVLNTLIGFVQEYKAGKAIEALSAMVSEDAAVIRDAERTSVPASQLVVGDIVFLQSGDKVPADMRVLESHSLQVVEAALTGESLPVDKEPVLLPKDSELGDRSNMVYSGSLVTYGTAECAVVATAQATELGRISSMLGQTTEIQTPLTRSLAKMGQVLTLGVVVVSVLIFAVGLYRGYPLVNATLAAITLAVAAIPEGLPAIITIALAIGVQRMARRQAVIRHLPAVETLGSTTVICSDKTGTLTRNEMTVQALWVDGTEYRATGVGYAPQGEIVPKSQPAPETKQQTDEQLRQLLLAGLLCSDATLAQNGDKWEIAGDPTEGALIVAAQKAGFSPQATRHAHPRLDAIPFESQHQFMATLHRADGESVLYLKGAPEAVAARCATTAGNRPFHLDAVKAQVEELASQGMRVLAFAARRFDPSKNKLAGSDVEGGLEFLGLQGMIDPPRPEAVAAIGACHQAGITVKMITGDHHATASAIGRQIGLLPPAPSSQALSGAQLGAMDDDQLRDAATETNVFARVAPEHKLRLVRALQAQQQVVAMTGDGVNDAPALKQADIGVAMGITGTAVSKEAADIVLADDNFASIAAAVEEGRRVYDNLLKSLAFVLPTNLGEALILLLAVLTFPLVDGEPLLPMLPTQILWINLVATVTLSLPLAFEAKEPDVMRRLPRKPGEPLLNRFVVGRTVLVSLLMTAAAIGLFLAEFYGEIGRLEQTGRLHAAAREAAYREAQTIAVTAVVAFQIFYVLNCRSLKYSFFKIGLFTNPYVYLGIGILVLLQLGFIYLPFMNSVFGSTPLPLWDLLKNVAVGFLILPIISIEKAIRARRNP